MNHELTPVLKSWQFFLSCRRILGEKFLTTLYNRSPRQIYRWSADPDFTSQAGVERNPLDRMEALLERLHERGRTDVALSALSIMANAINHEIIPIQTVVPDKVTIEAEMLDDYPALIKLHDSIRAQEAKEHVSHWCALAKREIEETLQKYLQR